MTCNDCKHSCYCYLLRHKNNLNICEDFKFEDYEEALSAEWTVMEETRRESDKDLEGWEKEEVEN